MKFETPQIRWNPDEKGRNGALNAVSMLQSGLAQTHVLATAGTEVNLWKWSDQNKMDYFLSLTRHEGSVNAVAFSPCGLHLATAGEFAVIVWSVPVSHRGNSNGQHYWSTVTKESDLQVRVIPSRAGGALQDLSWSRDSKRILIGSLDHSYMVLEDVNYGKTEADWKLVHRGVDHQHYVQGVAYDPLGVYLATMSSDRTIRLHPRKTKKKKAVLKPTTKQGFIIPPMDQQHLVAAQLTDSKFELGKSKILKYRQEREHCFADEATLQSFYRRLAWTNDGAFLIAPSGVTNATFATLIYARHHYEEPYKVLSGLEKVCDSGLPQQPHEHTLTILSSAFCRRVSQPGPVSGPQGDDRGYQGEPETSLPLHLCRLDLGQCCRLRYSTFITAGYGQRAALLQLDGRCLVGRWPLARCLLHRRLRLDHYLRRG